jgi:hypothetical protein
MYHKTGALLSNPYSTINQLQFCPRCEEPFDLSAKLPIMHYCCVQTTCKECWRQSFNMMDEFDCFFACGRPSRDVPDAPKVNAGVKRTIEENIA